MPGVNIVMNHSRRDFPDGTGVAVSHNVVAVSDDSGYYRVADLMIDSDEEPFENGRSLGAEAEGYKTAHILNLKDLRENMPQLDDAVMVPEEKKYTVDRRENYRFSWYSCCGCSGQNIGWLFGT